MTHLYARRVVSYHDNGIPYREIPDALFSLLTKDGASVILHLRSRRRQGLSGSDVPVVLRVARADGWEVLAEGRTDGDGRFRYADRAGTSEIPAGSYRVEFDTGSYYAASVQVGFYPENR